MTKSRCVHCDCLFAHKDPFVVICDACHRILFPTEVLVDDYDELKKYPIMRWFKYEHLPPALQEISRAYCELAFVEARRLPGSNEETAVALRKLLEAKDAAVRASVA